MDVFKLFRGLIWFSLGLAPASASAVFLAEEPPDEVASYFYEEAAGPLYSLLDTDSTSGVTLLIIVLVAFIGSWFAALLGMLAWKSWSRTLFFAVCIFSFALLPLGGTTYATSLQVSLEALTYASEGALLVLLLVDPIRGRFQPARAA